MKKYFSYAIPGIVIVGYLIIVFSVIVNGFNLLTYEYKFEEAQKAYNKYTKEFVNIVDSLNDSDEDFRITGYSYFYERVAFVDNVPIDNNFKFFFEKLKGDLVYERNDVIYFQLWSNLDIGKGICYIENIEKFDNEFVTSLELLDQPYWYYYVEE